MSEQPATANIPKWDLADRMRKALRHAGIEGKEMAIYLGVAQATVSTWINGRIRPSKQTLRLWALRTGVSYDWLCHGDNAPCFETPDSNVSAGQAGFMIPCSSPPAVLAFAAKLPRRTGIYHLPIELPAAA